MNLGFEVNPEETARAPVAIEQVIPLLRHQFAALPAAPDYDPACGLTLEQASCVIEYARQTFIFNHGRIGGCSREEMLERVNSAVKIAEHTRSNQSSPTAVQQLFPVEGSNTSGTSLYLQGGVTGEAASSQFFEIRPMLWTPELAVSKFWGNVQYQQELEQLVRNRGAETYALAVNRESNLGAWLAQLFGTEELIWFDRSKTSLVTGFIERLAKQQGVSHLLLPVHSDHELYTQSEQWNASKPLQLKPSGEFKLALLGIKDGEVVQAVGHGILRVRLATSLSQGDLDRGLEDATKAIVRGEVDRAVKICGQLSASLDSAWTKDHNSNNARVATVQEFASYLANPNFSAITSAERLGLTIKDPTLALLPGICGVFQAKIMLEANLRSNLDLALSNTPNTPYTRLVKALVNLDLARDLLSQGSATSVGGVKNTEELLHEAREKFCDLRDAAQPALEVLALLGRAESFVLADKLRPARLGSKHFISPARRDLDQATRLAEKHSLDWLAGEAAILGVQSAMDRRVARPTDQTFETLNLRLERAAALILKLPECGGLKARLAKLIPGDSAEAA